MSDWRPPRWVDATSGLAWRFPLVVAAAVVVAGALAGLQVVVLPLAFGVFLAAVVSPLNT